VPGTAGTASTRAGTRTRARDVLVVECEQPVKLLRIRRQPLFATGGKGGTLRGGGGGGGGGAIAEIEIQDLVLLFQSLTHVDKEGQQAIAPIFHQEQQEGAKQGSVGQHVFQIEGTGAQNTGILALDKRIQRLGGERLLDLVLGRAE